MPTQYCFVIVVVIVVAVVFCLVGAEHKFDFMSCKQNTIKWQAVESDED
jgi:hypothetical protein